MKEFRVTQDANYVQGYLRYGHREGIVEAESKEDALDKLRNDSYTEYLDFVLDDYSLEDADYDGQPFKIEEIEGK